MDSIFRFGLENGFANMERKGKREKRERKRLAIIRKKKEKKTNTKCHCRKLPLTHGGDGGWGKKEEDEG